jgi:hypothetical protein
MAAKTWFLPPGTTFTPDGIIRLGAVIKDFKRPTLILLEPDANTDPKINLPPVEIVLEKSHVHSRNLSSSVGGELWAKFLDLASASMRLELESRDKLEYGSVDHEVHQFKRSLTPESLKAIVSQPAVRQHMDSGLFSKRPVYIVSGLRVVKTGMKVIVQLVKTGGGGGGGPGPPAGTVPVEIGADVHGERNRDNNDSWETAPGIIFAYRLNIIREKKDEDRESEIFSHRTSFMTGLGDEDVEMEVGEVLLEDLEGDFEDDYPPLTQHNVGEDICITFVLPEELKA